MDTQQNEPTNPNAAEPASSDEASPLVAALIGWGVLAFIVSIVMCTFNDSAMVLQAGFWAKCCAIIIGSVLGAVGAVIGDALRKFARPDQVYTTGGFFHLIGLRLFWGWGPQVIGLLLGACLGCVWVLR